MKSAWQDDTRASLLARIDSVNESMKGLWGRMTPGAMLAHIAQSLRMATGELPCRGKKLPLRYFPLKQLVIYLLPFPKGTPTAPELLENSDASLDASKQELHRLIGVLAARDAKQPWPVHPAFGNLTTRAWGVLIYRHLDHHLRQFGA